MTKRDDDHFELDAHALAMIAAYRREEALPADVRERVWDRVESDVAGTATSSVGGVKWSVVLLAAAAAIAAVAIGAQVLVASEAAPQPQQAPYEHAGEREGGEVERPLHVQRERAPAAPTEEAPRVLEPIAAPPVETAEPGAIASSPIETTTAEPRSSKPRTRRPSRDEAPPTTVEPEPEPEPEPTAPADTLADETRMLERARKALSASRPIVALAILDDYQRRFPAARLAPERNALRAIALCDAGRSDEGSRAADAFLAKHSGHALASRVRRACDR